MYAVIDLETTGLRPTRHDRIVEIAIVHVDGEGRVEREWCTLVNPGRDLGPQHIHGVTAAEARRAPTFGRIAGAIAALLCGRVVVAHNLAFDGPFLAAEFARLGISAPVSTDAGLCTMRLAASFLPSAGRSLRSCCVVAGVNLPHAHSALYDTRAAAGLLSRYLISAGQPPPWAPLVERAAETSWPEFSANHAEPMDRHRAAAPTEHFLSRLVEGMPRLHRPDADTYLDLLDRALVGRFISATDADALVAAARALGLGRAEVHELHRRYLRALVAGTGGSLTERDRRDLLAVAALLALSGSDVDRALAEAASERGTAVTRFRLAAGDAVVFTGETVEPRREWENRARAAGLAVNVFVTERTRLLVAADADTMSVKAERARSYGIPVVHPSAFAALLEDMQPAPN
jgi:DNA polymerase-3 subunit epsilon